MEAVHLINVFDPGTLKPGIYVAEQDAPAYPMLRAMTEGGVAELAGERFGPGGRKIITVRVGHKANVAGRFGIAREFFLTALRDYEDWQQKWWREAIQNSVDAGASTIDCLVEEVPDGFRVRVTDNGSGMDEDTLLNKFLFLGGTTKVGAGTTGGFGKAKELLLLPWLWWRIVSRAVQVEGVGIDYEVTKVAQPHKGVLLEVVMPRDQATHPHHAKNFIGRCTIPGISFLVNGDRVFANVRRGRQVETIEEKAEVFHNKSAQNMGGMLVRINGLFMFNQWLDSSIEGTVFVELIGKSTDLLTANRDGIRDFELRRGLQAFQARLSKDTASALKGKKNLFVKRYVGTGLFDPRESDATRSVILASAGTIETAGSGKKAHAEVSAEQIKVIGEVIGGASGAGEARIEGDHVDLGIAPPSLVGTYLNIIKGQTHYENAVAQLAWRPDFLVSNEEESFHVPKKLLPEGMIPTTLKLAKVWAELCRYVFILLGSRSEFGVGWLFSESFRAAYQRHDDAHWLMLNPYKDKLGDETWNPNQDADLKHLFAFAVHEATHRADGVPYHDESFSSALTFNMAKTADGYKQAKKIAASIVTRGTGEALRQASLQGTELVSYLSREYKRREDELAAKLYKLGDPDYRTMMDAWYDFKAFIDGADDSTPWQTYVRWAQQVIPGSFSKTKT